MTDNIDQTYDIADRRYQGAFFTPKIWVDEAHLEVEKVLGSNWREDCVVWDCCAGTGNLTRGYSFQDLILSTLVESELAVLQEEQGSTATVFGCDFLNTHIADLPQIVVSKLCEAASAGKRVVFFMNPPYGTASDMKRKGETKVGMADTHVKATMQTEGIGKAASNLYAQFLYQVNAICTHFGIEKRSVCVYAPISYLSSDSYSKLRALWYSRWEFCRGYMLQASNFPSLSGDWAITFVVWNEGRTTNTSLTLDICELQA